MWLHGTTGISGTCGFFRLGQSHETLPNHYQMNFVLMKHHGFSLRELDDMIPFERDVYVLLLRQWIEEENRRLREQQARA